MSVTLYLLVLFLRIVEVSLKQAVKLTLFLQICLERGISSFDAFWLDFRYVYSVWLNQSTATLPIVLRIDDARQPIRLTRVEKVALS